MILQVRPARLKVAGASHGDHVDENHQTSKQDYEDEHGNKVRHKEPWNSPKRPHKACNGHNQEQDAQNDDRPLQNLYARVVGFGGEPDSGTDDGDGEEHSNKVDGCNDIVAKCHFFFVGGMARGFCGFSFLYEHNGLIVHYLGSM